MGYNEQQQKRAQEVSDYLSETAYLEKTTTEQKQTGAVPELTVSVGEQFKGDAVKLGKKAWKPSKAEKEMNRKIDAAKAITPKATADTLELSGALKKRNVVKQQLDDYAPEKI